MKKLIALIFTVVAFCESYAQQPLIFNGIMLTNSDGSLATINKVKHTSKGLFVLGKFNGLNQPNGTLFEIESGLGNTNPKGNVIVFAHGKYSWYSVPEETYDMSFVGTDSSSIIFICRPDSNGHDLCLYQGGTYTMYGRITDSISGAGGTGSNGLISSLSDSTVLIAGNIMHYGTDAVSYEFVYDFIHDIVFPWAGQQLPVAAIDMAKTPNGKVYVTFAPTLSGYTHISCFDPTIGRFTYFPVPSNFDMDKIVAIGNTLYVETEMLGSPYMLWSCTDTTWNTNVGNFNGYLTSLDYDGTNIIASGNFNTINGMAMSTLGFYTPASGTWTQPFTSPSGDLVGTGFVDSNFIGIALDGAILTSETSPNGLINIQSNSYAVYPNPATILVHVQGMPGETITITDITGKILSSQTMTAAELTLSTSELAKGMYIITNNAHAVKLTIE